MPRFPIKAAQLHTPLFLNGSNLGDKLSPASRTGLQLQYDTDLNGLIVQYQHAACFLPSSNVASSTLVNPADIGIQNSPVGTAPVSPQSRAPIPTAPAPRAAPMAPTIAPPQPRSAQVSHPVQDAVNGMKMTSPSKYLPHTSMQLQAATALAVSGAIQPGAAAPTKADLQAAGKLPPDAGAPVAPAQKKQRASRAAKAPVAPKVGEQ